MNAVWCGPYALGIASGLGYAKARQMLRDVADYKGWGGLAGFQMDRGVDEVGGWETEDRGGTLETFTRLQPRGRWVVLVSGHYLAIVDGQIFDSQHGNQGRRPHPLRRCHLKRAWRIPEPAEASSEE